MNSAEDLLFEAEVLRIARARWPQCEYAGSTMIDGRERDGVFESDDVIHYIEATTSRRSEKARNDAKKLFQLMSQQQKNGSLKGAVGWFVTKGEPTAEQRDEVRHHGKQQVKCLSFSQFQQSIVDVPAYLSKRENHLFGSVIDPVTKAIKPTIRYIPLDLTEVDSGVQHRTEELAENLILGRSYTLLGDYGAGKSMTLRQIFFHLRDTYHRGGTPLFPLYINLREHSGQDDPAEVLERHARRIGYDKPSSLVSAWRAGFCILIIDGFDEITTLGISNSRTKLTEARRRSLEAIRKLIEQTPPNVGFIVAGREHFFSTPEERNSALGVRESTEVVIVGEFTQEQIKQYLSLVSSKEVVFPDWLPTRPLLVAYIATRNLLDDVHGLNESVDATDGWHYLLDKIFERESKISPNLDGGTLRKILERLSSTARATTDGLGPISQQQIRTAYIQICDSEPDDQANLLLQRLPGLGVYRDEDDSRTFVDMELAEVCRARDVTDFIINPYGMLQDDGWRSAIIPASSFIGKTAVTRICRNITEESHLSWNSLDAAFKAVGSVEELSGLKGDLAVICLELPYVPSFEVVVDGGFYENYIFSISDVDEDFSKITFRDCLIECLELDDASKDRFLPIFQACYFSAIRGRSSAVDLPSSKFDLRCTVEKFADSLNTQSGILSSSLSRGEKLILTMLRKLFVQSVSGRAESALFRGLDLNDRQLVPDAIRLLQQHKLVTQYNRGDGVIWVPVRKEITRARRILGAPNLCEDLLLLEAKNLG